MGFPVRSAFFYTRPVFAQPCANCLLIALARLWLRQLSAETKLAQQRSQRAEMVVDMKGVLNELAHAPKRPALGGKPGYQSPCLQKLFELLLL